MPISPLSPLRFQGVLRFPPENAKVSIPFDFKGQTYWTTGEDLLTLAEANIAVFQSGLLTIQPDGKPRFIDITGDHHDAVDARQAVFKRLADKAK